SSVFENNLLFQSALVFKKWIPFMIRNRFMGERYNYRTGQTDKGFYRGASSYLGKSLHNMYSNIFNKFQEDLDNFREKKEITKSDKIAIRKVFAEMLIFATISVLSKILMPPPDEEKDKWYIPNFWEHLNISIWDDKREFN